MYLGHITLPIFEWAFYVNQPYSTILALNQSSRDVPRCINMESCWLKPETAMNTLACWWYSSLAIASFLMPQSSAGTLDESRWDSPIIPLVGEIGRGFVRALLMGINFEAVLLTYPCSNHSYDCDWRWVNFSRYATSSLDQSRGCVPGEIHSPSSGDR